MFFNKIFKKKRQLFLSLVGLFLLFAIAPMGLAEVKISISKDELGPYVYFDTTGKDALRIWEYLDKAQKAGGKIGGDAAMHTSSLEAPNIDCYRTSPDPYYHGEPEGYEAYLIAHEKDSDLYRCSIRLDWQGVASGH